ncbi:hypothetical protein ACJX0J_022237, partial [Zea mays]
PTTNLPSNQALQPRVVGMQSWNFITIAKFGFTCNKALRVKRKGKKEIRDMLQQVFFNRIFIKLLCTLMLSLFNFRKPMLRVIFRTVFESNFDILLCQASRYGSEVTNFHSVKLVSTASRNVPCTDVSMLDILNLWYNAELQQSAL